MLTEKEPITKAWEENEHQEIPSKEEPLWLRPKRHLPQPPEFHEQSALRHESVTIFHDSYCNIGMPSWCILSSK